MKWKCYECDEDTPCVLYDGDENLPPFLCPYGCDEEECKWVKE